MMREIVVAALLTAGFLVLGCADPPEKDDEALAANEYSAAVPPPFAEILFDGVRLGNDYPSLIAEPAGSRELKGWSPCQDGVVVLKGTVVSVVGRIAGPGDSTVLSSEIVSDVTMNVQAVFRGSVGGSSIVFTMEGGRTADGRSEGGSNLALLGFGENYVVALSESSVGWVLSRGKADVLQVAPGGAFLDRHGATVTADQLGGGCP